MICISKFKLVPPFICTEIARANALYCHMQNVNDWLFVATDPIYH